MIGRIRPVPGFLVVLLSLAGPAPLPAAGPAGAAAAEPFLIGVNPGTEPAVAVLPDGAAVVVFESGDRVAFAIPGVVAESPLAPPGPEPEVSPDVAALPDSGFAAVWLAGTGNKARPPARSFGRDGVPATDVLVVGGHGYGVDISVYGRPSGGFVVAWAEFWPPELEDVYVRVLDASGTPTGPVLQANAPGTVRNIHPQVATAPDGSFTVAWGTNDIEVSNCLVRRYAGSAGGWDDVRLVAEDGAFPDIATAADGSHLVAWAATVGKGNVRSLRQGGTPLDLGGSLAGTVAVAMHPTGPAVVAWLEGGVGVPGPLRARLLDATGRPAGEILNVAEDAAGVGAPPGLAVAADGRIIFAWRDESTGRILGCWWGETLVSAASRSWGSLKGLWR